MKAFLFLLTFAVLSMAFTGQGWRVLAALGWTAICALVTIFIWVLSQNKPNKP